MGDNRKSEGSASWRLTSLWRPVSQSFLPSSARTSYRSSFQDGWAGLNSHFSLFVPSLFGRPRSTRDPEKDIENGTSELVFNATSDEKKCESVREEEEVEVPRSQWSDGDSTFASTEVITPSRPGSSRATTALNTRTWGPRSSSRTMVPELRDTRFLAELPAIPARASVRSQCATTDNVVAIVKTDRRDSISPTTPPPVPAKPPKVVLKDEPPTRVRTSHLVLWNGPGDPENSMNWPTSRKWATTLVLGFVSFCVAFASSTFVSADRAAAAHFDIPSEIMVLATSMFMFGLATGPFVWSPLIEKYGRKGPLFIGLAGFAVFQIPVAVAQNSTTVFVCRYLAGVFGCSPLIAVVNALNDLWEPLARGTAMAVFSAALLVGTAAGPLVGGPIVQSPVLGWRWTSWIVLVLCFPFGMACAFIYRESSAAVLLQRRARVLRQSTMDWALHAPAEEDQLTGSKIFKKHFLLPLAMLFREPILLSVTAYMSCVYGLVYLTLEAYSFSFTKDGKWPLKLSGLQFGAFVLGILIGCLIDLLFTRIRFAALVKKYGKLRPEERLLPMVVGGMALPVGLLVSAWTSELGTPAPRVAAALPLGLGSFLVFLQGNNYIIECYAANASPAIAINTSIRSLFAAAFAGFAKCMFTRLEPKWAGTILAIIAFVFVLVPIFLYKFGTKLRAASKYIAKLAAGNGSSPTEGIRRQGE